MIATFFRPLLAALHALGRALLALVAFVGLSSAAMAQPSAHLARKTTGATNASALLAAAQRGHVRVIVLFKSPVAPDAIQPGGGNVPRIIAQVAAARDPIVAAHFGNAAKPTEGKGFPRGLTSFPVTPGFTVNVNARELEALAADPRIVTIQHDAPDRAY